jgi:hypothetical protein
MVAGEVGVKWKECCNKSSFNVSLVDDNSVVNCEAAFWMNELIYVQIPVGWQRQYLWWTPKIIYYPTV